MYEQFLRLLECMKYMKLMIPERPANTKISLYNIAHTTGNNILTSLQKT